MTKLIGHDAQTAAFLAAMRSEKCHHGWLFTGPEGIGKMSLALALSKRLLAEAAGPAPAGDGIDVSDDHPVAHYLAAQCHPDFIRIERLPRDAKIAEKPRDEWPEGVELSRSIRIDQIRALRQRFATRPSLSARRVVLIDGAEYFEVGAANALLKSLEEPPAGTIFLLVSHAAGRLLPTIRSRCRTLRFAPLGERVMRDWLAAQLPATNEDERGWLIAAAQGAPGKALAYAGLGMAELEAQLSALARDGDRDNAIRTKLAQSLSGKPAQRRYEAFLGLVPKFIARKARGASGSALETAVLGWEAATMTGQSAVRLSLDPQMTVFGLAAIVAGLAPPGTAAKA